MNTSKKYGVVARFFHALMLVLVPLQLIAGFWMVTLSEKAKLDIYPNHKLSGLFILALVLMRMSWRMVNVLPNPPKSMKDWEVKLSHLVHRVLYGLLVVMPLSGWAMATLAGSPPVVPGIGKVMFPFLTSRAGCKVAGCKDLLELMSFTHFFVGVLIALLLLMHFGAGILHITKKDGVFERMYFGKG